jgi:Dolichyl-phosphate-mannose-protein mannosyltransferase
VKRYLPYVIFTICASLYMFPFMRLLLQGNPEGMLVYGAVRVTQGQVFARDFFEIVGPGTFYWVALFFKIFGVTFVAAHLCLFITSLGTGLSIYVLSRRVCTRYDALPAIICASTTFGLLWPTISHHLASNCFALAAVVCAVGWLDRPTLLRLFGTGIFAGITACFHLPKGVFLFGALLVWLWIQCRRQQNAMSSLARLGAGFGSVIAVVLVYFGSQHALWDLYYANYLFPSTHYGDVNTVPYAQGLILRYWHGSFSKTWWWTALPASVLLFPLLLIAALPVVLPVVGWLDRRSFAKPEITLYWLCAVAIWLAEIHRKDIDHLAFGSPLLIILIIFYFEQSRTKLADMTLQVILICSVSLGLFNLVLVLTAHSIETRVGTVKSLKKDKLLAVLNEKTKIDDEIFVYPSEPLYYFLTKTRNPIRYGGLMYNYNDSEDFKETVRALDQRKIKYVVWDTGFFDRNLKVIFTSAKPMDSRGEIVEPYLRSHYKVVWEDSGVELLERSGDDQMR